MASVLGKIARRHSLAERISYFLSPSGRGLRRGGASAAPDLTGMIVTDRDAPSILSPRGEEAGPAGRDAAIARPGRSGLRPWPGGYLKAGEEWPRAGRFRGLRSSISRAFSRGPIALS